MAIIKHFSGTAISHWKNIPPNPDTSVKAS